MVSKHKPSNQEIETELFDLDRHAKEPARFLRQLAQIVGARDLFYSDSDDSGWTQAFTATERRRIARTLNELAEATDARFTPSESGTAIGSAEEASGPEGLQATGAGELLTSCEAIDAEIAERLENDLVFRAKYWKVRAEAADHALQTEKKAREEVQQMLRDRVQALSENLAEAKVFAADLRAAGDRALRDKAESTLLRLREALEQTVERWKAAEHIIRKRSSDDANIVLGVLQEFEALTRLPASEQTDKTNDLSRVDSHGVSDHGDLPRSPTGDK